RPFRLSISPNCETNPAWDWRNNGQLTRWEYRYRSRSIVKPKTWLRWRPYGNCDSGIRNSAVQPSESTRVATSHTASQAKSSLPSLYTCESSFTPEGLTPNS